MLKAGRIINGQAPCSSSGSMSKVCGILPRSGATSHHRRCPNCARRWRVSIQRQIARLRIVEDAGLPTKAITFAGNAANLWHNILAEAQKHQNAIARLTQLALEDYPDNPLLRDAAQSYFDTQNTGQ